LYHRYKDHPIYAKLVNLNQLKIDEQITAVKRQLTLVSWDSKLTSVKQQVVGCGLITKEIKVFISESVGFVLDQFIIFSKLSGVKSYIRIPLNFNPVWNCSLAEEEGIEKYILDFTESSPSSENFLSLNKR